MDQVVDGEDRVNISSVLERRLEPRARAFVRRLQARRLFGPVATMAEVLCVPIERLPGPRPDAHPSIARARRALLLRLSRKYCLSTNELAHLFAIDRGCISVALRRARMERPPARTRAVRLAEARAVCG